MIINNPLDLIGNTPLVYLNKLSKKNNCNIYLKLEKFNLSGSGKDRAVKKMIENAILEKKINQSTTIIEPTSGNTGIAIANICSILSLKCIIIAPENIDIEKIKLLKALNVKIIFTDAKDKMKGCIKKAKELLKEHNDYFMLSQFDNYNNYLSHYETTGKEIYNDLNNIDCFIATYGSGGTISGVSKYLKKQKDSIKCICVKPSKKKHIVPGISSNIVPKNYLKQFIDKIVLVDDVDTLKTLRYVIKEEGIMIGISGACAISGAIKYVRKNKNIKNIVVLVNDGLERYLSNEYVFYLDNVNKKQVVNDITMMYDSFLNNNYNDVYLKYLLKEKEVFKIYKTLKEDAKNIYLNDPSSISIDEVISLYPGFFATFVYRIANLLWKNESFYVARMFSEYAHSVTSIDIHPQAKIGKGFAIDHGSGIVIGQTCIIGENVRMYQGVTLGALSLNEPQKYKNKKRHPTIKNNVIIYANSTILGGKTIVGNNVIVGGNSFITSSIKDDMIIKNKKAL